MIIYVGDAKDVVQRIRSNHCSGNVEGSALRKAIASLRGYALSSTKRPTGTQKIRIDSTKSLGDEEVLSSYLASGFWKYVMCDSPEESRDFQWYVIEALTPVLNFRRQIWNSAATERYISLLRQLEQCTPLKCAALAKTKSGPGVYVFCHDQHPSALLS